MPAERVLNFRADLDAGEIVFRHLEALRKIHARNFLTR